jgi:hypothetical protein
MAEGPVRRSALLSAEASPTPSVSSRFELTGPQTGEHALVYIDEDETLEGLVASVSRELVLDRAWPVYAQGALSADRGGGRASVSKRRSYHPSCAETTPEGYGGRFVKPMGRSIRTCARFPASTEPCGLGLIVGFYERQSSSCCESRGLG